MGVIPPSDPFEGGRVAVETSTGDAQKLTAIAGECMKLAHHARHIRKHAEWLGEQAGKLADTLGDGDCAEAAE